MTPPGADARAAVDLDTTSGRDAADPPAPLFVGPLDDPDRYELLGDGIPGGEGTTWAARYRGNLASPLAVAVKVLHRPSSAPAGWPTTEDRARWRDQTALLRHSGIEHVVRLHDVMAGRSPHPLGEAGDDSQTHAIVEMEWVPGDTLAKALRGRPATSGTLDRRISFIRDVASAVANLHSTTRMSGNPTVHRDVTPSNCIITPDRGIVIIDLSTMQLRTDEFDADGHHTPPYSAPEVLASPHRPRLPSADRYAVGAVAYFCLTGEDPPAFAPRRVEGARAAVRRLGLGNAFLTHLLAPLSPAPEDRPEDLVAWADRLRTLARRPARIRRAVAVSVLVIALIAGGTFGASRLMTPARSTWYLAKSIPDFPTTTWRGTGNRTVSLPKGVRAGLLTLTNSGTDIIKLTFHTAKRKVADGIDEPAGYVGTTPFGLLPLFGDPTSLQVVASGAWRVTLQPFSSLQPLPSHGSGDGVYAYTGDGTTARFTQHGPQPVPLPDHLSYLDGTQFTVNAWSGLKRYALESYVYKQVDQSSSAGTVPLPRGPVIIEITSSGPWTMDVPS